MNQRADARLARVPSSCPLAALRTPRPASYHVVTSGDGRRGLPSTRRLERGVTGDDEAGASRLPLIRPTKSRAGRKEAHGGGHGCAFNHGRCAISGNLKTTRRDLKSQSYSRARLSYVGVKNAGSSSVAAPMRRHATTKQRYLISREQGIFCLASVEQSGHLAS
jgi:hypothetical protein